VNDLMMAARIESGALPSEPVALDLREATEEAVSRAQPRATLLQAELSTRLPKHPVVVEADPEHIGRILDNLINNALTYGTGRPRISVIVSDGLRPQVAVEDRGLGIRPDMRERVFERFFRIDNPSIGAQPGTGLGLYIGRVLAERQGGSLILERSDPGRGSKFVLRLPPAATAEKALPPRQAEPAGAVRQRSVRRQEPNDPEEHTPQPHI
jgi:signal transduction histidine kinase